MTISCRTNCGEQIDYEKFEFPDGFIYYLPKNTDGSIHNCPNLPKDGMYGRVSAIHEEYSEEEKIGKEIVDESYELMQEAYGDLSYWDLVAETKDEVDYDGQTYEEAKKKELLKLQMRCLLFPAPFMEWDHTDLFAPEEHDDFDELISKDLELLAYSYEGQGMLDCAIRALTIQNFTTNDQNPRILELTYKKNKTQKNQEVEKKIEAKTVNELRENLRRVERTIKNFIRKQYSSIEVFRKEFPEIYSEASRNQKIGIEKIKREHNDVIEFITIGDAHRIIKEKKSEFVKKEELGKNLWKKIDWEIINDIFACKNTRNGIDHYSGKNIENDFDYDAKSLCFLQCEEIINFFEKLELV